MKNRHISNRLSKNGLDEYYFPTIFGCTTLEQLNELSMYLLAAAFFDFPEKYEAYMVEFLEAHDRTSIINIQKNHEFKYILISIRYLWSKLWMRKEFSKDLVYFENYIFKAITDMEAEINEYVVYILGHYTVLIKDKSKLNEILTQLFNFIGQINNRPGKCWAIIMGLFASAFHKHLAHFIQFYEIFGNDPVNFILDQIPEEYNVLWALSIFLRSITWFQVPNSDSHVIQIYNIINSRPKEDLEYLFIRAYIDLRHPNSE